MQLRKKRWDNLRSGEELFGLCVTQFPELEEIEKEMAMLDRLYTCVDPQALPLMAPCKAIGSLICPVYARGECSTYVCQCERAHY